MPDLDAVDASLRSLLLAHADGLVVSDGPRGLVLEDERWAGKPWGFVAGVKRGARYVSVYAMCAYASPTLVEGLSPALRARMQGKSCFNFTRIDEGLFGELDGLLATAVGAHESLVVEALAGGDHPVSRRRADRGSEPADGRH